MPSLKRYIVIAVKAPASSIKTRSCTNIAVFRKNSRGTVFFARRVLFIHGKLIPYSRSCSFRSKTRPQTAGNIAVRSYNAPSIAPQAADISKKRARES